MSTESWLRQRVSYGGNEYGWRTAAWCDTHDDLAWQYGGGGGVQCMYCLVVETSSSECKTRPLNAGRRP